MGYFAVLRTSDEQACTVVRCHINLWALPTLLPARRLLYFDLGLKIQATGSKPVKAVEVLLPFRVEHGSWPDGDQVAQDLYDYMCMEDVAELVLGGPVTQSQAEAGHRILRIGGDSEEFWLVRTDSEYVKPAADFEQRPDSSLYVVPLQREILPGESRYFRIRWRLLESEQLWQRNRRSGGARVDFRVCDVRESRYVHRERTLRERLCQIESINFFLMAPKHLRQSGHSPDFRYLRVLEPEAWRGYLASAAYTRFNRGILVYYWRYMSDRSSVRPQNSPISADNPFRVYIDFQKASVQRWLVLKVVLGVFLANLIVDLYRRFGQLPDLGLKVTSAQWLTVLGIVGISTIFGLFKGLRKWVRNRFLLPRQVVRSIERFFLSLTYRKRR